MDRHTSIRLPARLLGVRSTGNVPPSPEIPAPPQAPTVPAPVENPLIQEERAQIQRVLAELTRAIHRLDSMTEQAVSEVRGAAIDLAITVASHFLMSEVQAGVFPFEVLVERALERLAVRQTVTVSLHPEDLTLLQGRWPEGTAPGSLSDSRWMSDARLPRGACKVEAADRSVLFDPEHRLAALREALTLAANADEPVN